MKTKLKQLTAIADPDQVASNIFIITHECGGGSTAIYTQKTKQEISDILLMFNSLVFDYIDNSEELYSASLLSVLEHYGIGFKFTFGNIEETENNVIDMYYVWDKGICKIDEIKTQYEDQFPGLLDIVKDVYDKQHANDVADLLLSMARDCINEDVLPSIKNKSDNTYFICAGKGDKDKYYVSILDSRQLSDEAAQTIFLMREKSKIESLIKVVVDFNELELSTTFISHAHTNYTID